MLKNVFLFTGEEKYLLHQELNRRTGAFVQKYGTESLFTFKTDEFNLEALRQSLYSGGLFVQKKMIIVYGIPTDGDTSNKISAATIEAFAEEFMKKAENIDPELILIFISYKPDKRTRFYTFLKKDLGGSNIKEFAFLKPAEVKQFIRQKTPGIQRSEAVLDAFLAKTGNGLFHICNELDKLVLRSEIHTIHQLTEKDIHTLTFGATEADNFELFDTLLVEKNKALELIVRLQEEGTNRNAFLGTVYRGLRNRLFALDCDDEGITDSKTIASTIKAHPFVVSKMVKHMETLQTKKPHIIKLYKGLIELENDIKTGKKTESQFRLDVKKLIIYHG